MKKLEILFQDEEGRIRDSNGNIVLYHYPLGKLSTLVKESLEPLSEAVKRLEIPDSANAFLPSRYNRQTRMIRDGKHYSTYGIQFYYIDNIVK